MVSQRFCHLIKHHDQSQLEKESIYFILLFSSLALSWREVGIRPQVRILEAETDAEATEECWSLAQPASLQHQEVPADVWHYSLWAVPNNISY